jgi:hypothetical protein
MTPKEKAKIEEARAAFLFQNKTPIEFAMPEDIDPEHRGVYYDAFSKWMTLFPLDIPLPDTVRFDNGIHVSWTRDIGKSVVEMVFPWVTPVIRYSARQRQDNADTTKWSVTGIDEVEWSISILIPLLKRAGFMGKGVSPRYHPRIVNTSN